MIEGLVVDCANFLSYCFDCCDASDPCGFAGDGFCDCDPYECAGACTYDVEDC